MGGKRTRRIRATAKRPKRSVKSDRAKRIPIYAAPFALIVVLVVGYYTFYPGECRKPEDAAATRRPDIVRFARSAKTLDDLLKIPVPDESLASTPGGTCASMPVMYVAVGRRLGYPLKPLTTKGHVFVRWDGKDHANPAWRERFNMEGTNGFNSFPDEYYKTWPFKLTNRQVKANGYLASLTPRQEFAQFLAARGHCGTDHGQLAFAARCYENAHGYDPDCPAYRLWFGDAALASGYRSKIPALARLLARRMRRKTTPDPDLDGMQRPSDLAAAAAESGMTNVPTMRIGHWQSQFTTPGLAQPLPPTPYGLPQAGTPQPGDTNPHQPHQPGTPGQPPR